MSACLSSGASAAYSFELEKIKSPPSSSTTRATSPSSTITESSNSISTRKPRTQRKRPNQSYNEAAALLSTAYPNIFFSPSSTNHLYANKKTHHHFYGFDDVDDDAELLLPSESIEEPPDFLFNPILQAYSGVSVNESEVSQFEFSDEFESILVEEVEEGGVDSIMGKLEPGMNRRVNRFDHHQIVRGFKFAENIPLGLGLRTALRDHNNDDARFHTVDLDRIQTTVTVVDEVKKSKKKKKKVAAAVVPLAKESSKEEEREERSSGRPMLKLDYDGVLEAWSDKATPFGEESEVTTGADVNARLAQIDLFGDSGVREASVLRYKEKRQTRLFYKKIRYQVRKLNADQRPRVKGRFVRRSSASPPSCQR